MKNEKIFKKILVNIILRKLGIGKWVPVFVHWIQNLELVIVFSIYNRIKMFYCYYFKIVHKTSFSMKKKKKNKQAITGTLC